MLVAPHLRHSFRRSFSKKPAHSVVMAASQPPVFWLDGFAKRQWDPAYKGTKMVGKIDQQAFVDHVHKLYYENNLSLVDGYAPFCKHLFVPNFCGVEVGQVRITEENKQYLMSDYVQRRPEELAVLSRWFPRDKVPPPPAKYLDLILYSREQLIKEASDLPSADKEVLPEGVPWGIIGIKGQDEGYETPMAPITMLRNALGRDEVCRILAGTCNYPVSAVIHYCD